MRAIILFLFLGLSGYSQQFSLPNEFVVSERLMTIGTDMDIKDRRGNRIGKIEERVLNIGKKFDLLDSKGKLVATAKQTPFKLYTEIKITDNKGVLLGYVEAEIMESIFSVYSIYTIRDENKRVLAKSKKLNLFKTKVDVDGIITIEERFFTFVDTWDVKIRKSDIDDRLVVFIPAFISSVKKDKEE